MSLSNAFIDSIRLEKLSQLQKLKCNSIKSNKSLCWISANFCLPFSVACTICADNSMRNANYKWYRLNERIHAQTCNENAKQKSRTFDYVRVQMCTVSHIVNRIASESNPLFFEIMCCYRRMWFIRLEMTYNSPKFADCDSIADYKMCLSNTYMMHKQMTNDFHAMSGLYLRDRNPYENEHCYEIHWYRDFWSFDWQSKYLIIY